MRNISVLEMLKCVNLELVELDHKICEMLAVDKGMLWRKTFTENELYYIKTPVYSITISIGFTHCLTLGTYLQLYTTNCFTVTR